MHMSVYASDDVGMLYVQGAAAARGDGGGWQQRRAHGSC